MAALEEKPQTIARSSSASDFVDDDGSPPSAEQDEPSRLPEPLPPVVFTPTRRAMPRRIIGLTLGITAVAVMVTLFIPGIPWSISSPRDYVYPVVAVLLGLLLALVPVLLFLLAAGTPFLRVNAPGRFDFPVERILDLPARLIEVGDRLTQFHRRRFVR